MHKKKVSTPNRHQARESAIEVLYAWQSGGGDDADIPSLIAGRLEEEDRTFQDQAYLRELVNGVTQNTSDLDSDISKVVNRSIRSVANLELNIVRLALWEMKQRLEIPYKVIINEALELARDYTDEPARGFINGVLDKLAQQFRQTEVSNRQ
ncbi:MAG: transcription antitermination factor NusB [Zetaproteobacteria bacterium CG_4_9_14_3_um_filter_49_83]|nr:MAG: transcription antitermination factor NusB [Zetaproteobacteria bacterium CG1_02_49_23]PIQ31883.1 MAG: transcription antitermination factor NusB [Zetaproteobacteria bacterium CG17_big_fil_post_rev_8_21_14_2_50_50_13]PIV30450.1 MAG: transcription antitermination factor NusB [Zetaproteobacteria bacterium CG02_land_8_20_14_3_00_50_9]PIY55416.1 MAG: transcription antitermination factor NusB [Zetaproteobacteria bacterium CG_4_10_14_0_8_um_filter_49_80]PJA34569.1 MAG: transcription antiterminat